ncbi:hypothetical protein CHUAL_003891 [Chamberlinius hualienensis]
MDDCRRTFNPPVAMFNYMTPELYDELMDEIDGKQKTLETCKNTSYQNPTITQNVEFDKWTSFEMEDLQAIKRALSRFALAFRNKENEALCAQLFDSFYKTGCLMWVIRDMSSFISEKNASVESNIIPVRNTPLKIRIKLQIVHDDLCVSLAFVNSLMKNARIPFIAPPIITFILMDWIGEGKQAMDIVRRAPNNWRFRYNEFHQNCTIFRNFKSKYSTYDINDSVTIFVSISKPKVTAPFDGGYLNWSIDNFNHYKQQTNRGIIENIYSPCFYLKNKSNLCQSMLWLNGYGNYAGQGLTLQIDVFTSNIEAKNMHTVTIIILNQKNTEKHLTVKVDVDFHVSKTFYINIFNSNDLEKDGFVHSDMLNCKISID